MAKTTKSIKIEPDLLAEVLKDAKSDARSFSAWICIAAKQKLITDRTRRINEAKARTAQ